MRHQCHLGLNAPKIGLDVTTQEVKVEVKSQTVDESAKMGEDTLNISKESCCMTIIPNMAVSLNVDASGVDLFDAVCNLEMESDVKQNALDVGGLNSQTTGKDMSALKEIETTKYPEADARTKLKSGECFGRGGDGIRDPESSGIAKSQKADANFADQIIGEEASALETC